MVNDFQKAIYSANVVKKGQERMRKDVPRCEILGLVRPGSQDIPYELSGIDHMMEWLGHTKVVSVGI